MLIPGGPRKPRAVKDFSQQNTNAKIANRRPCKGRKFSIAGYDRQRRTEGHYALGAHGGSDSLRFSIHGGAELSSQPAHQRIGRRDVVGAYVERAPVIIHCPTLAADPIGSFEDSNVRIASLFEEISR